MVRRRFQHHVVRCRLLALISDARHDQILLVELHALLRMRLMLHLVSHIERKVIVMLIRWIRLTWRLPVAAVARQNRLRRVRRRSHQSELLANRSEN